MEPKALLGRGCPHPKRGLALKVGFGSIKRDPLGGMGSVGAGEAMPVVSCGREKVQSPREQLEQRHGHHLSQLGAARAWGTHPAPVLTVAVPCEELAAPPCPRQEVQQSPQSAPREAQGTPALV